MSNSKSRNRNNSNRKNIKREQPRKDNSSKRVNFDNERLSKVEDKIKDIADSCKSNDPSWYANNPELMRSAATLPFSQTTGMPLDELNADVATTATQRTPNTASVPGILSLHWNPTIGGAFLDAVNQAKDSMYSYVVHANSRNTSYTAEDLMLLVLAGASLFSTLAIGIRAYGTMRMYDQRNKYLPDALIRAQGFDPDDLRKNLSHMWFDMNELIARSSQIWIPNTMPLLERWFWLSSNIYMDSDSVKGQYYMFTPSTVLKYNEEDSSEGGFLEYIPFSYSSAATAQMASLTWNSYLEIVNAQFAALLNSEDRGVIMGDIMKAYGADRLYAITPMSVDYQILPVYDREVLTQIENATAIAIIPSTIVQDPNQAKLSMTWTAATGTFNENEFLPSRTVLNFHQKETPIPEQIMVATRLKAQGVTPYAWASGAIKAVYPLTCGTEYCDRFVMWMYEGTSITPVLFRTYMPKSSSTSNVTERFQQLSAWSSFDWAPWIYTPYLFLGSSTAWSSVTAAQIRSDGAQGVDNMYGDWDNYTIIDTETLRKMNITALYSEFGVPVI